jgi:glycerol-3-phosphate dehydrogenase (NAD(P)+)
MNQVPKIAVIGAGSWATALIKILCEEEVSIHWLLRTDQDVAHLNKYQRNQTYLSSVSIDTRKVHASTRLEEVLEGVDMVLMAVPAAYVAVTLKGLSPDGLKGKKVITSIKGMVPDENMLVTAFLEKYYQVAREDMAIIAGPCHAEEVAMEKQSYLTVAGEDPVFASQIASFLGCHYISVQVVNDLLGIEYAAVMKNIIAIACGIAHGLNYGDNFQAVLVSNAMQEIRDFIEAVDKRPRDLMSSAYLGDLLVTTYSQFSRNRTFGNMVGRGYSVKSAQMEMEMVAEGYFAVKSIFEINKQVQMPMPVVSAVYHILYEKISPIVEMRILKDKLH